MEGEGTLFVLLYLFIHLGFKDFISMKVLVINWRDIKNPEAGGAEIHIDEILKRKPSDWQVDFVSAAFKGAPDKEETHFYTIYRIPNNSLFNFTFYYYWKKVFSKKGYDLIIDDISKIPLATPLFIKNTPILAIHHHIHGKSLFKELFFPMALYVYWMEKFFLRFYKSIPTIVMAESNQSELKNSYQYEKAIISPTGMEFEFIRSHIFPNKEKIPTLIYFGRLKKYKRVDHIIEGFSFIKKSMKDAVLWIAGKGDQEDALKMFAKELDIEKDVIFYGFVDEEKKIELLSRSWVYLIASEKEGWGLTVIEANAAGIPVVGYEVEGLRDSIQNNSTGYLVRNGDTHELAEKALNLLRDEALRKEMSQKAVDWASRFSWENTAKDFYKIVESNISIGGGL
jgi:glycosyltransferase involved in cell wall biosynthesis